MTIGRTDRLSLMGKEHGKKKGKNTNAKRIKKERVGSDKSMEGIILHKVSPIKDAGILNSISD